MKTEKSMNVDQCLAEGLIDEHHRDNGYGQDFNPSTEEKLSLACAVAKAYPEQREDWQTTSLKDHHAFLISDYLSK